MSNTPEDTDELREQIHNIFDTSYLPIMCEDELIDLITLCTQKAVREAESAATQTKEDKFETDIRDAINRHSKENGSNTPDFVLAGYLTACLKNFDYFTRYRDSTNPTERSE